MKKLIKSLENYPVGIVGTGVALMVLADAWQVKNVQFLIPISVVYTWIALAIMLIKIIFYPKKVWTEIKNPVVGTFYPIIDMAVMLLAQYYLPVMPEVAKLAWTLSVIVHLAYYVLFTFFVILKDFKFTKLAPSIYVVLAGAAVATETSPGMRHPSIALFTLYLSMISFIVLYPIMLYKIFKKDALPISIKPTAALLASPASLTLISYLIVVPNPNMYLVYGLAILSIINIIIVYTVMIKLFVTGFKPLFSAFTFPLTISTLVMYQLHDSLIGINSSLARIFNIIGNVELAITTLTIIYILINLLILFLRIFTPKAAE